MINPTINAVLDVMPLAFDETINARQGEQSLLQENQFLRSLVVDLLIRNQKLRCAVQKYSYLAAGS